MVDFRVSDGLHAHPKIVGVTLEAIGLWTLAGSWCAHYQTDGHIPAPVLTGFAGRRTGRLIAELTDRGLITAENGGFLFVDWLDYQRSRAEVEAQRELNRQRVARARAKKEREPPPVTHYRRVT